jgi:hypothetical protein
MWKEQKTTNEVEKKGAHALFIIVPLNLTLKSTSTSLADDSYLGTLVYHMTLRTRHTIYEKKLSSSQIFKKKKSDSHDQFSFMWEPKTDSHCENRVENCVIIWLTAQQWSEPVVCFGAHPSDDCLVAGTQVRNVIPVLASYWFFFITIVLDSSSFNFLGAG